MPLHRPSADAFVSASTPSHRPKSRAFGRLKTFVAALAVMLLVCAAPNRSWSAVSGSTFRAYVATQIWLYTGGGGATDVTNTYYVMNGQSYIVYGGQSIPVVLNHEEGHLYNTAGHIIGYLVDTGCP
jgi:hypothetical protein